MIDGNTAALNNYLKEQEDAEEKWEQATKKLESQYGQVMDEIYEAITNLEEETGFDFDDLLHDLLER